MLFSGRGLKYFTPLRCINFTATLACLGSIAVTEDTAKAPDVGPIESKHEEVRFCYCFKVHTLGWM